MTMHFVAGPDGLPGGLSAGGVSADAVDAAIRIAGVTPHLGRIRSDSANASGDDGILAQRAAVWAFVDRLASNNGNRRADSIPMAQRGGLVAALCQGLGLRKDGSRIVRGDAYAFPGVGVDRSGGIVRPLPMRRALVDMLPDRPIGMDTSLVMIRGLGYSGEAKLYQPGQTVVPLADVAVRANTKQVHTIITATKIGYGEDTWGTGGAEAGYSLAAEKAEAASRTLLDFWETALANGLPGTDWGGIINMGAPRETSLVDFTSATIGQMYAEIMRQILSVQEAAGWRGTPPNTAFIHPLILQKLYSVSNIDTGGGGVTGVDLFSADQAQSAVWGKSGISRVISTPSLGYFDANGTPNANGLYAAMLLTEDPTEVAIRKTVALRPAPIKTATIGLEEWTYYALRAADIDIGSSVSVAMRLIKVK